MNQLSTSSRSSACNPTVIDMIFATKVLCETDAIERDIDHLADAMCDSHAANVIPEQRKQILKRVPWLGL